MWNWLRRKKTYIVSAVGAISAVFGFVPTMGIAGLIPILLDFLTSPEMTQLVLSGGLATIRHGMKQ